MSKHYLSLLSFATLLCMMLFGTVSCKKDDTPDSDNADFFIDVDFLPESETNGEVAPRLVVNFNDKAAMIELRRPSTSDPMESVLLLCPDNEAMMLCGNDSLMVCAAYDMETYTPSHDVLIVTPIDDNALVLTKGFMNWSTNTLTTGDMMVLPIERTARSHGRNGDDDIDGYTRKYFFNNFVKPLAESFEQVANYSGIISPFGIVFSYIGATITTNLTVILYSDDPEGLYDATEFSVTNWTGSVVQDGILNLVPGKYSEVASKLLALIDWHADGGHGKVNDYVGGETDGFSYTTFWGQSSNAAESAGVIAIHPPAYNVSLNVSNVTENSAYLKGRFQYTSSITPVEMGYIVKLSGGPEHKEYDMNFQGITLSGLQKATKYTAFAYVKSAFGERVLSPGVSFWTLGFEAFPNSLSFPTEGDTKYVALSYPEEDITSWDITSKPSWCTITQDGDRTFAVTVGASTDARSGTITITAHSNALGTITQDITVTQFGAIDSYFFTSTPFDNTKWNVSGTNQIYTTGTRRIGEWHSSTNGGYYSYHNEPYSETNNVNENFYPTFYNNTLYIIKQEDNEYKIDFINDSIYLTIRIDNDIATIDLLNNVTCHFSNGSFYDEITLSRYFINEHSFCYKIKEDETGSENYGSNVDWCNYKTGYETEIKFTINGDSNNCFIELNQTSYYDVLQYGSEYTGTLHENSSTTYHGSGTWEYGIKDKITSHGNHQSFSFLTDFLILKYVTKIQ